MNQRISQNLIPNKQSNVPLTEEHLSYLNPKNPNNQQTISRSPTSENHPGEYSRQQLQELLTCHVCFCHVNNPMMCPSCSKLYCQNCIRRCLSLKAECPHCRKQIKSISFMANCNRFVNDLLGIVNQLIDRKAKEQICKQHNVQIDYYCQNCSKPVCCQCQMFGSHKQHSLKKLNVIYEARYNILREMLSQFKTKLRDKQMTLKDVENQMNQLKKLKQKRLKQLQQFADGYRNKINQQTANQAAEIEKSLKFFDNLLITLQQLEGELSSRAEQAEKSGKYYLEQDFVQKVHKCTEQQLPKYQIPSSIIQEVIPPFFQMKFIVQNFSKKKLEKSTVFSPIQKYEGSQWRLKVYPSGNQLVQNNYLSMFIEMVSSIHESTVYEYQIQIVNRKNPNQRMIRQYQSNFQPGQSWGYNKYIKLENLMRQGYVDPVTDELEINYYIRNPFYYSMYKQKQLYLRHLDNQINMQDSQIKELEAMLAAKNNPTLMSRQTL